MRDRCTVDTETTSLIDPHLPGGRRVWEVAIIRDQLDGTPPLCAWLQITDVDLDDADPRSLDIGRFRERFHPEAYGPVGPQATLPGRDKPVMLWGCTEANAARTIAELTADAIITGSNPAFDQASLADLLRRHDREPSWYHHPRDIPNIATGYLLALASEYEGTSEHADWTGTSYSTRVLSEACGIDEPADRHSAWADVMWMRAWDDKLSGRPYGVAPVTMPG